MTASLFICKPLHTQMVIHDIALHCSFVSPLNKQGVIHDSVTVHL